MEISEEELGGKCVTLVQGDDLKAVPRSHRRLITPEIESWWADPIRAIRQVARKAASPNMKAWFRAMAKADSWQLELHKSSEGFTQAGFWLSCPDIFGAEVAPPSSGRSLEALPPELAAYYRLVDSVSWMIFGAAGGLNGPDQHVPVTEFGWDYAGQGIEPARTSVFGWSPCGDMLIYTRDGRGGWLCHGNGKIHFLGTVLDTIDWVYGELLADRCPDFDYGWLGA